MFILKLYLLSSTLEASHYSDYKEMLQVAKPDAFVPPHTLHFQQVIDALESGCHVLVEKPMTCSSAEAAILLEKTQTTGKVLQVSYQRHFQLEFLYIHDAIALQRKFIRLRAISHINHCSNASSLTVPLFCCIIMGEAATGGMPFDYGGNCTGDDKPGTENNRSA